MQLAHLNQEAPAHNASFPTDELIRPHWKLGEMIGRSPAMQRLFLQMRQTAAHLRIATIEGDPGSGKTLAAQTLHTLSRTPNAPFLYTLAARFFDDAQRLLKESQGGTLYLARIHELSLEQQGRLQDLLAWLDHQRGRSTVPAAPQRILTGSLQPLRRMAASSIMRTDLVHRLTAIRFTLPPLRERREDLPLLADFFAQQFGATHGKPIRGLGPGALARLLTHTWPGNVRELESVIATAALDCEGQWIKPINIPALGNVYPAPAPQPPLEISTDDPNLDRAILRHVTRVLTRVDGNKLRAAKLLGISRSTLYRLLEDAAHNAQSAESS